MDKSKTSKATQSTQQGEHQKPAEYVHKGLVVWAINEWEKEREQLAALAYCLVDLLAPKGTDNDNETAWRLAQIAENITGSIQNFTGIKSLLGLQPTGENHE